MSAKIYSGLRFTSCDLLEVHQQIMAFRPIVARLTADALSAFLAKAATERIDKAAMGGAACKSPLFESLQEFWDREKGIKETQRRDPRVDFEFKVFVLPFEGRIYGIASSEQGEWVDVLKKQDWVEDWSYWNNSDRPKGIPQEEWDERSRVWHDVLAQSPAMLPSGCGLIADLSDSTYLPMAPDVLPFVPSVEERARRIAFNIVRSRRFALLVGDETQLLEERSRRVDHIGAVIEAADYAQKDGAAEVDAEIERVRPLLPEITEKVLLGK